jgi:hypothetical protein
MTSEPIFAKYPPPYLLKQTMLLRFAVEKENPWSAEYLQDLTIASH